MKKVVSIYQWFLFTGAAFDMVLAIIDIIYGRYYWSIFFFIVAPSLFSFGLLMRKLSRS